jgi:hypothetical protein
LKIGLALIWLGWMHGSERSHAQRRQPFGGGRHAVSELETANRTKPSRDWRSIKRQRNRRLTIRLDDAEWEHIQLMAARAGITPSAHIRQVMLGADIPKESFRPPDSGVKPELAKLLMHIGKTGSNLNQIAKVFNSGGFLPKTEIQEQLTDLTRLRVWIKFLLRRLG